MLVASLASQESSPPAPLHPRSNWRKGRVLGWAKGCGAEGTAPAAAAAGGVRDGGGAEGTAPPCRCTPPFSRTKRTGVPKWWLVAEKLSPAPSTRRLPDLPAASPLPYQAHAARKVWGAPEVVSVQALQHQELFRAPGRVKEKGKGRGASSAPWRSLGSH